MGYHYHINSGVTSDGIILDENNHMTVLSGGTANNTMVSSGGSLVVSSGGTATNIIEDGGMVYIGEGAIVTFVPNTFSGLVLYSDYSAIHAYASIHSGTTADGTKVSYNGNLYVYGGTANNTTVNSGSYLRVGSGGTTNSTTINGGYFYIYSDSTANNNMISFCSMYIFSGGTANSTTVDVNGSMIVVSGGTATNNTVNDMGSMYVSSGGTATNNTVNSGGHLCVNSGGTATNNMVNSGGWMLVSSGGVANHTTVSSGGHLCVNSGGTANSTTVNVGGKLDLDIHGTATDIVENGGCVATLLSCRVFTFKAHTFSGLTIDNPSGATVHSGTIAVNTTVGAYSYLAVYSGGIANGTTVNSSGRMYVDSSGTANGTTVNSGGTMYVDSGGTANGTTVSGDYTCDMGRMYVSSGGTANSTTVNSRGNLYVISGGTANNTTVNSRGNLYISSGGTTTDVVENGGYVYVDEGANVKFKAHTFSGLTLSGTQFATVHSGTTANSTTVKDTGFLTVYSGGIANSTTVDYGGFLEVCSGGTANSTTVNSSGIMYVSSGGVANCTKVNSGGTMYVSSGGKITGKMTFFQRFLAYDPYAVVSVYEGGIVDFDLTGATAGGSAFVNNLSVVKGTPTYTLTVDGTQSNGTYKLAGWATGFNKTISVVNTDGTSLGTLTVGQTANIGSSEYTLNLGSDDVLSVSVAAVAPEPVVAPPYLTGCFAGGIQSMLAKQSDGAVTVYREGSTWGTGLTLDPGWTVVGTGDFNGDGLDDFLRVNTEGYVVGEMSLTNVVNEDIFVPQVLNFLTPGWDILGTGDFDGNGADDVLIANPTAASETVGLLGYWKGGTEWTLINGYSAEWECVSTGDFNADGKCDMLWRNSFVGEGGLTYNAYCTWIVDNPVDWRMVSVADPSDWQFLCSGDFDGNGSHDIAMINGEGVIGIWGVNDGYLSSWSILSAVDTSAWTLAGVGDFNGDGTDDIAWCNNSTNLAGYWQISDKQLTTWANIATLS